MTQGAPGAGMRLTWRWDIVWLGRFAGAFVIASGLGLAIWSAAGFGNYDSDPLDYRIWRFWYMFVSIAWGGVAIILVAELVKRLAGWPAGNGD
jgi:hypothetical protein